MSQPHREVLADAEELARCAGELVASVLENTKGDLRVCLAGGSTPKRTYELLSSAPLRPRMPWKRIHWFWGDERMVPPDHKDSNARMARAAMLDKVGAAADHVHAVTTTGATAAQAASAYERDLKRVYGAGALDPKRPLFDVTLLGVGDDGHIASLFPGTAALTETARWTAAVVGAKPEARVTLTYPSLNSSRHLAFLVAGASKAAVLKRIAGGEALPAAGIKPVGELHWLLDKAAAGAA